VTSQPSAEASVLVVCTGNICRSPIGHLLLEHLLAASPVAGQVDVRGAGTYSGHAGEPMQPGAQRVLRERGIDPAGFRATPLSTSSLRSASLVLTAERSHRRACVRLVPSVEARAFTLLEAGRLAAAGASGVGIDGLVASMHERRGALVDDSRVDVPDPYLEPDEVFRATLDSIERSLVPLVPAIVSASR
jgi:protein-tyrosine phosphatase